MRTRTIHLINPRTNSFTTRPLYFNRALYSPLAGLLAVAASIPRDRYEVVLTDENIEEIDFDLNVDMVGISAMTSYVRRGYEIADRFRAKGIPVIMGGVHPSFMTDEALEHADAVCVGEVELVMDRILDDLEDGALKGVYRAERLHPLVDMPMPRYDLVKRNRYVNRTFVQTSRGCHHACAFCSEHLMNGLRFRYRPVDEVIREIESCGQNFISLNDADFFGTPERPKQVMQALKGRGIRWQAGVTSRLALNDELLELAAESGCYMLSIGFESISRRTLTSVHKHVNRPETFAELVDKIHGYGMLVFGLFIFGFDTDDPSVFEETVKFNREADYDMCAYSVLTPYPGTLLWFNMERAGKIVSYDWNMYDQGTVTYRPQCMSPQMLRDGQQRAYREFYSLPSIARRFPLAGARNRLQWSIYNMFFRRGEVTGRYKEKPIAEATAAPAHRPRPPLLPQKREWREIVEDGLDEVDAA